MDRKRQWCSLGLALMLAAARPVAADPAVAIQAPAPAPNAASNADIAAAIAPSRDLHDAAREAAREAVPAAPAEPARAASSATKVLPRSCTALQTAALLAAVVATCVRLHSCAGPTPSADPRPCRIDRWI